MDLSWAEQCCDAESYLSIGRACARQLASCWHPLRPVGAGLWFSIPARLGLPATTLIALHFALIAATSALSGAALAKLTRSSQRPLSRALDLAASTAVLTIVFLPSARQALSDAAAGCFALSGLFVWVLRGASMARWASAGALLGCAAFMRSFYLYPVLLTGLLALGLALRSGQDRVRGIAFFALLALPICIQLGATYRTTGQLGYIDPSRADHWASVHFGRAMYGYDTLLPNDPVFYDASACFRNTKSFGAALRDRDFKGFLCVAFERQWFYFGSSGPFDRVYLRARAERRFTASLLALHMLAFALAARFVWFRRAYKVLLVPLVFTLLVWAQGSAIIPETRFLVVVYVLLWLFAWASMRVWLTERRSPAPLTAGATPAAAVEPDSRGSPGPASA